MSFANAMMLPVCCRYRTKSMGGWPPPLLFASLPSSSSSRGETSPSPLALPSVPPPPRLTVSDSMVPLLGEEDEVLRAAAAFLAFLPFRLLLVRQVVHPTVAVGAHVALALVAKVGVAQSTARVVVVTQRAGHEVVVPYPLGALGHGRAVVRALGNSLHQSSAPDDGGSLSQLLLGAVVEVLGILGLLGLKDALDALQGHHDHVGLGEEDAQHADAPLLYEDGDLVVIPAACGVQDHPARLAPHLLVRALVVHQLHQRGDGPRVDHGLDLPRGPRGDVAQRPARLLLDLPVAMSHEPPEARDRPTLQHDLGEVHRRQGVAPGIRLLPPAVRADDVPHRAEGRLGDAGGGVEEELDEAGHEAVRGGVVSSSSRRGGEVAVLGVDDRGDVVRRAVAEVAEGPARSIRRSVGRRSKTSTSPAARPRPPRSESPPLPDDPPAEEAEVEEEYRPSTRPERHHAPRRWRGTLAGSSSIRRRRGGTAPERRTASRAETEAGSFLLPPPPDPPPLPLAFDEEEEAGGSLPPPSPSSSTLPSPSAGSCSDIAVALSTLASPDPPSSADRAGDAAIVAPPSPPVATLPSIHAACSTTLGSDESARSDARHGTASAWRRRSRWDDAARGTWGEGRPSSAPPASSTELPPGAYEEAEAGGSPPAPRAVHSVSAASARRASICTSGGPAEVEASRGPPFRSPLRRALPVPPPLPPPPPPPSWSASAPLPLPPSKSEEDPSPPLPVPPPVVEPLSHPRRRGVQHRDWRRRASARARSRRCRGLSDTSS
ncbi:hypothetical protein ACHAWF_018505 [Thalassiosira exigua]